jgi:hypothetical protein
LVTSVADDGSADCYLCSVGQSQMSPPQFVATDALPAGLCGMPNWISDPVYAAFAGNHLWLVVEKNTELFLVCHDRATGRLISSRSLMEHYCIFPDEDGGMPKRVWPPMAHLAIHRGIIAVSLDRCLIVFDGSEEVQVLPCDAAVTALVPALPHVRSCIYIVTERSVSALWAGESTREPLAQHMQWPKAALTSDGQLLVLDQNRLRVIREDSRGIHQRLDYDLPDGSTVDLLRGPKAGQFARLTKSGKLEVFQIPE